MAGAGHGSTFQDRFGNWWHASTMCITVHHNFERRVGIWPAGFDEDGILFCNTRFGDYPISVPKAAWDPWADALPRWMLLSYRRPVKASDALPDHPAQNAVDESVRTWWAAPDNRDQWLQIDLLNTATIHAVQINFAEEQCRQYFREGAPLFHQYVLEASGDGQEWFPLVDRQKGTEDVPHNYVELEMPVKARHVRLTIHHMPGQGKPAVSGLRIFGRGAGEAPDTPDKLNVQRNPEDPCHVELTWDAVPDADGYNIRWGIAPDKLYSDWLVHGQTELTMRCLNANQNYHFAIEAFNAAGISSVQTSPCPCAALAP